MNKGTPANPPDALTAEEVGEALILALQGDYTAVDALARRRVFSWPDGAPVAALATKPAEPPATYAGTVHDGRLTVYANGDEVWSCDWPGLALEKAVEALRACRARTSMSNPLAAEVDEAIALTETQQSRNATRSDEQRESGVGAVQPPAPEPLGEAVPMPGTSGFTMACFKAEDVPIGTKLYSAPPAREQRGAALTAERIEQIMALVDDYTDHFAEVVKDKGRPLLAEAAVLKIKKNAIRDALALSPADPLSHQTESDSGAVLRPTLGDQE